MSAIVAASLCFLATVTPYAPSLGGINGGRMTASGTPVSTEYHLIGVACGPRYPFGTRFRVDGLAEVGYKTGLICIDRGGMITNKNLDVLVFSGKGKKEDWRISKLLGKRRMTACVTNTPDVFRTQRG
jgi:3D (Asp-Asp-Asp) domain-containing protein